MEQKGLPYRSRILNKTNQGLIIGYLEVSWKGKITEHQFDNPITDQDYLGQKEEENANLNSNKTQTNDERGSFAVNSVKNFSVFENAEYENPRCIDSNEQSNSDLERLHQMISFLDGTMRTCDETAFYQKKGQ